MSDEASYAPKEMVNIRLPNPEPGAQGEELPLRMAVIGDFTGKDDKTDVAQRKIRNINQNNFNEVMGSMDLNLSFAVPNKVTDVEGEQIPVDLKFDNINSFNPDEVAKQVPQLKRLLDFRKKLIELRAEALRDPDKLVELNQILSNLGAQKE